MTEARKKAEELVERFDNEVFDDNDWYMSKQCAIICCDEIIESHSQNNWNGFEVAKTYEEVKRIIKEEL